MAVAGDKAAGAVPVVAVTTGAVGGAGRGAGKGVDAARMVGAARVVGVADPALALRKNWCVHARMCSAQHAERWNWNWNWNWNWKVLRACHRSNNAFYSLCMIIGVP